MRLKKESIRYQLVKFGFYLTALALAILTLGTQIFDTIGKRQSLIRTLYVDAEIIGRNSIAAILFNNKTDAFELLSSLQAAPDVLQAAIFLQDGSILAEYAAKDVPECQEIVSPVNPLVEDDLQVTWCSALLYYPVTLHGQKIGGVALEYSLKSLISAILNDLFLSVVAIAVTLGLSLFVWRRFAIRITEPLHHLSKLTQQVQKSSDFSLRAEIIEDDEVGMLAMNFNRMMEQLHHHHVRLNEELFQRRNAEERLNELAYYDNVTSLHNRHYFKEQLEEIIDLALQNELNCAVLFIDLDGFKKVNDTLGHDTGDELLRLVSKRLLEGVRNEDIVCRLGGDEFAIITNLGVTRQQVEMLAKRLVTQMSSAYELAGKQLSVTASIGISLFPEQAESMDILVRNADSAMYQAKEKGKNCYCIYQPSSGDTSIDSMTTNKSGNTP